METASVVELYAPASGGGGQVGSGYRLGPDVVLTAAHVVAALPIWGDAPAPTSVDVTGVCQARPLGEREWVPAVVRWRDDDSDVAILSLATLPLVPAGSAGPRWGRLDGTEPIAVTGIGFPWAQERSDGVRDTEQLFGFIAPASMAKSGLCAVTVLSAAPASRAGGSAWAGMSGAALFAGPFLVGVVVVDPARFGTDRVVAAPIAPLLDDVAVAGLLEVSGDQVVGVGARLRLAVTDDVSVALVPPYRAVTPRMGREPARLLLPEYGIVPFVGRSSDLQTVVSWCLDGGPAALRVVVGGGGSGKTRLAAQACVSIAGHGWQTGFANPNAPGGQAQLAFDRATLVVVDDADLNVPLLVELVRTVGYWPPGAPPLRLLLLARHTAGWWDTLNQRTDRLAAELADPAVHLRDGELGPADRQSHHAAALTAFAASVRDPVVMDDQPPPDLSDRAFTNPLVVHMHALLTVCGAELVTVTAGDAMRERIVDAVLDRERARWASTFPAGVPTGGASTRHQAVTATTLLAPPTEAATARTLTAIDEFAAETVSGVRAAVVTWLRQLYPGADPPWVAPLRPDLLAEHLLATCPQLGDLVVSGYRTADAPGQIEQLLTELTRASAHAPVLEALDRLLRTRLSDLLVSAVDAPTGSFPNLLERALIHCPQPTAAAALSARLPERSTGLAALATTLADQAVSHHREQAAADPDAFTSDLAMALDNQSHRLAALGRVEQALSASEEAVTLYRELVDANPGAFTSELAGSLNNQSNYLTALGRREDALAAIDEAVSLYRELAGANADAFIPILAMALNNQCAALADLGRREDALTAIDEAVTLFREPADADPDAFGPKLAAALINQSNQLAGLGRRDDALAAIDEAVTILRARADADPDAFTPDLAMALNNQSNHLTALGRPEDALAAIDEAVTLRRKLAAARPDAFTPDLATALNNQSAMLAALGRRRDALAASDEAVTLHRELAATRPDAFTPDLATALNNHSNHLAAVGRREDALAASDEAVTLFRQLAAARPDAFTADVAMALNNQSNHLAALGRRRDALAAIDEAVTLRRELAAARPEAFKPELARSLNNQSNHLAAVGRREDALAASDEAVTLRREQTTARPDAFTPDLAIALNNQAIHLAALGRTRDALAAIEEGIILRRKLADANPDAFGPALAGSLNNQASRLAALGRTRDAEAAIDEAVSRYRELADANPDAFGPEFAAALNNQAATLAELGRQEDALAASDEAVTLYRKIADANPEVFTPDVGKSLLTRGFVLRSADRHEDALSADQEAVRCYQALQERDPDIFRTDLANALRSTAVDLRNLGRAGEAEEIERVVAMMTSG